MYFTNGLSILRHGLISLPDAMSYDKIWSVYNAIPVKCYFEDMQVLFEIDVWLPKRCFVANKFKQGYQYHRRRLVFSKLYCKHSELTVQYNIDLKTFKTEHFRTSVTFDLGCEFKKYKKTF